MAHRNLILIALAVLLAGGLDLLAGALGVGQSTTYLLAIAVLIVLLAIGLPWSDQRRGQSGRRGAGRLAGRRPH